MAFYLQDKIHPYEANTALKSHLHTNVGGFSQGCSSWVIFFFLCYNLTKHHFLYCDKQETAQQGFAVEVTDWQGTLT